MSSQYPTPDHHLGEERAADVDADEGDISEEEIMHAEQYFRYLENTAQTANRGVLPVRGGIWGKKTGGDFWGITDKEKSRLIDEFKTRHSSPLRGEDMGDEDVGGESGDEFKTLHFSEYRGGGRVAGAVYRDAFETANSSEQRGKFWGEGYDGDDDGDESGGAWRREKVSGGGNKLKVHHLPKQQSKFQGEEDAGKVHGHEYPVAWGRQEKEKSGADDETKTVHPSKQGDTNMGEQAAAGDNGVRHVKPRAPLLGRGRMFGRRHRHAWLKQPVEPIRELVAGDVNGDEHLEPEEHLPFRTKNESPNNDGWLKPQGVWTGNEGEKAGSGPENPVQNTEREWLKPKGVWTGPEVEEIASIRRYPVHCPEPSELEFTKWYQQRKENGGCFAARHHAQRAEAFEHRGRMETSPAPTRISPSKGQLNPTKLSSHDNERRFDVHYSFSIQAENGSVLSASSVLAGEPSGHPIDIETPHIHKNNHEIAAQYVVRPSNSTYGRAISGPWSGSILTRAGNPRKPVPEVSFAQLSQFSGVPTGHPSSIHPQYPPSKSTTAYPKVTTSEIPAPGPTNNAGKTIFLLYPGMIPVKFILDATTTYGDLKSIFRRRRFLNPRVKVEIAPWLDRYSDGELVEDLRDGIKGGEEFSVQIAW